MIQDRGGCEGGVCGRIVYVYGEEGDIGEGGGEEEGCCVAVVCLFRITAFRRGGSRRDGTYSTSLNMSVSTIKFVTHGSACAPIPTVEIAR
jgi:hypothetical protein